MTLRPAPGGPVWWRTPAPPEVAPEWVFYACRCGADMQFEWPRERASIRCFACGQRVDRPDDLLPALTTPIWRPEAARAAAARRPGLTAPATLVLFLSALAALFLLLGVSLVWGA